MSLDKARVFCITLCCCLLLSGSRCLAGEMVLPAFPNLSSQDKTYEIGGRSQDRIETANIVARQVEPQGEVKGDSGGTKSSKDRISYNLRGSRINDRISDEKTDSRGEGFGLDARIEQDSGSLERGENKRLPEQLRGLSRLKSLHTTSSSGFRRGEREEPRGK
jgi:hypothetical protein